MKVITFPAVTHLGEMDLAKKKPGSYEGAGLSVSVHPMAWGMIANLGCEGFILRPANGEVRLLDCRTLSKADRSTVETWGTNNGYLEPCELFKVSYYDADLDARAYFLFDRKEKAQSEARELERARVTGPIKDIRGTTKLLSETSQDARSSNDIVGTFAFDLVMTLYAEKALDVDGVWWSETLDPFNHSAPRGVIFNSRIGQFEAIDYDFSHLDGEDEFDVEMELSAGPSI